MLVHQSGMHFYRVHRFGSRALTSADIFVDEFELCLFKGWALFIGYVSLPGAGEPPNALDLLEGLTVTASVDVHGPL